SEPVAVIVGRGETDEEQIRTARRASERETTDDRSREIENENVPPRGGDDVPRCPKSVRERRPVAFRLPLGVVELRWVEREAIEGVARNPPRQVPSMVGWIGEKRGQRAVEVEKRLGRRVVARGHEPREALLEPERRIRLPSGHQYGRPILQRESDDTRGGAGLLEAGSQRGSVHEGRRGRRERA